MSPAAQSVLGSAGNQAALTNQLFGVITAICVVVWVAVAVATVVAVRRGRSGSSTATDADITRWVTVAAGLTLVTLIVVLSHSVVTGRAMDAMPSDNALRIQVTGNQWWWDVQYPSDTPSLQVTTANEIHIPTGRPVVIDLFSNDVIHSLWIPRLQGKIDLIPGRRNQLWLEADRPGEFRGQCAEFCGAQHANMALVVIAEPAAAFERWLAANRAPAPAPSSALERRGEDLVVRGPCAMCHAVQGTSAGGRTAPDLTHLLSRRTIAAGTLPNTRGHRAGWIVDPQHVKPGNRMPPVGLDGPDLQAVLAYLETLR